MKHATALTGALALVCLASPTYAAKPNPGEPLLGSFIEDYAYGKAQLAAVTTDLAIACEWEPCTLRDDFDGDGIRDLAFQVVRLVATPGAAVGEVGIAVKLTGGGLHLFDAGPATPDLQVNFGALPTVSGTWSCVEASGLVNPPAMSGPSILAGSSLVYWSGTSFAVATGIQGRN